MLSSETRKSPADDKLRFDKRETSPFSLSLIVSGNVFVKFPQREVRARTRAVKHVKILLVTTNFILTRTAARKFHKETCSEKLMDERIHKFVC